MPAGPVGSVWASGSWSATAWEENTWADASAARGRMLLLGAGCVLWMLLI